MSAFLLLPCDAVAREEASNGWFMSAFTGATEIAEGGKILDKRRDICSCFVRMSAAAHHARPSPAHPANAEGREACARCAAVSEARAARAAEREAMLRELAATGMAFNAALKRELAAREAAGGDDKDAPGLMELSLAYNRVAGGVRQTLALEVRLEQMAEAKLAAEEAEAFDFTAEADRVRAKVFALRPNDDPEERAQAEAAGEDHPSYEEFRWAQDYDVGLNYNEDGPLGTRALIYKAAIRDGAETGVRDYVEAVRRVWRDIEGDPATGPP